MNIIPAILPHSFEEIGEKCSRIEGIAQRVQIDLCDGVFGREKTWLPTGAETLPQGFSYEFDAMVNHWNVYVPYCISLGAMSIVAHVDMFSDDDITNLVSIIAPHSISLGVAVSNDKSVEFHADMVRKIKEKYPHIFIQVMGIRNIGEQGQIFDDVTPARVQALKQQFGDIKLQVDGGMILETAKLVKGAGADTLVVGSYIFGSDDAGIAFGEMNDIE